MNKIKRRCIDRDLILYKRYIDDILVIAKSQRALDETFTRLHVDAIKLSREKPNNEGWLPFLNVDVRILEGRLETKWYRKAMKKDLIIRRDSAHPVRTKMQAARNMIYTAVDVSSAQYKEEARQTALGIARKNGYGEKEFESRMHGPQYRQGAPTVRVPFINDYFSTRIQKIFLKHGFQFNVISNTHQRLKGYWCSQEFITADVRTAVAPYAPIRQVFAN